MGILVAADILKTYPVRGTGRRRGPGSAERPRHVHAVRGVSLSVEPGETLAIVGGSGSGKTTMARILLGIERPTSGRVLFDGKDVSAMRGAALRATRRDLQMVFQDPYDSLDPRLTVRSAVETSLLPLKLGRSADRDRMVRDALNVAGMTPADAYLDKRPRELSGGQRQRVAIARALATKPRVVVADEPVSMLDASIQAGVLNTLIDAQRELNSAYILITHDIGVARYMADRVVVMYAGRIVESGDAEKVIQSPAHPYTSLLITSAAHERREVVTTEDDEVVAQVIADEAGCAFAGQCRSVSSTCRATVPELQAIATGGEVACFHPNV